MMRSFQLSLFQLLYLLIAALLECRVATQTSCKQAHQLNINSVQGDSIAISCLTTTHLLQSLTVKLHKSNQDKNILMFPGISPASEHQRWSVRKDDANVTLHLKHIRLSDNDIYDCQVYKDQNCLQATQINLRVKKCKTLDSVHLTPGSSVLLPCSEHPLQNRTERVTWKIVNGHQSTDIAQYQPPNKPSSSTEKLPKPLYERTRQLKNGSLLIRDTVHTDELWYRCRANEKTCYEVKLLMKVITENAPTTADSTVVQIENNNSDESETVTTNLTVVVMTTVVSLCVLISLTICVILYLKKRRPKNDNQIELNCQSSMYYSEISGGLDVPLYSLVQHNTNHDHLWYEEIEAPAYNPDHIYDNRML